MPRQAYFNPNEPSPIRDRRREFLNAIPVLQHVVITESRELLPTMRQSRIELSPNMTAAEILRGDDCAAIREAIEVWAARWHLSEDWALADTLDTLATWETTDTPGEAFVHWETRYTLQPPSEPHRVRQSHNEYRRIAIESAGLIQSPRNIDTIQLEWLVHFAGSRLGANNGRQLLQARH